MVGSARGTHQRQQTLSTVRDLVCQRTLEHAAGPQCAAVVQMHLQSAALARRDDLCAQHPGRVPAAIDLMTLELRHASAIASSFRSNFSLAGDAEFAVASRRSKPSAIACIMPYSIPLWTIFTK